MFRTYKLMVSARRLKISDDGLYRKSWFYAYNIPWGRKRHVVDHDILNPNGVGEADILLPRLEWMQQPPN